MNTLFNFILCISILGGKADRSDRPDQIVPTDRTFLTDRQDLSDRPDRTFLTARTGPF